MKNIWVFFLSENFQFLEVKSSVYLNRRVFVMIPSNSLMQNLGSLSDRKAEYFEFWSSLIIWLHTRINFSIGYNAKKSKVSHLLQFHGPKSDPGFGGMWQPLESATDPGIFMSSSPLRKHMTLLAIWHPKKSSCSGSQTGMTDQLVVALHPAK